ALGLSAMALELDIEAIAKELLQRLAACGREATLPGHDRRVQGSARAAGEGDHPVGAPVKPSELDVRGIMSRRLKESSGTEPHETLVAGFGACQQHNSRPLDVETARARSVLLIGEIDRKRAAHDRLDTVDRQLFGKLKRTEHIVGIGKRQRRLPVLL